MTNEQLREELDAVVWLFKEVRAGNRLPVLEAEAVVHCLRMAWQADRGVSLIADSADDVDVNNAVQAINVALTAMAAAEQLGLESADIHGVGLAGVLHDIGMVRVPKELLAKDGKLSPDERAVLMRHPADGAAIILEAESALDVPAVAAYEHHIRPDGAGYPTLTYPRTSHRVSRLIAVCDTYHALISPRPFRQAWTAADALTIIGAASGRDLDAEMVTLVTTVLSGNPSPGQGS